MTRTNAAPARSSHLLVVSLLAFFSVSTLLAAVSLPQTTAVVLLALITCVCAYGIVRSSGDRGFDLFSPATLTLVSLWLAYCLNGLFILFFPDEITVLWGVDVFDRDLTPFLLVILLGVLSYVIGYGFGGVERLAGRFQRLRIVTSTKGWPWRILLIYLIGWVVRVYYIREGRYTSFVTTREPAASDALLYKLWFFCFFAYVLAWIYWARPERSRVKAIGLLGAISALEVGYFLFQGSKTYLSLLLVLPLIVLHYHGERIGTRRLLVIGVVLIAFVFPYVALFRETTTESYDLGDVSLQVMRENVGRSVIELWPWLAESDRPIWREFVNRWGGIAPTVAAMERVPSVTSYYYGGDLKLLLAAIVPRFLMPGKPAAELPTIFAERVIGAYGVGISPFPVAEGYLNFGVAGVILGMMIWGALQRTWYRILTDGNDSLKLFVYIATFYDITNVNSWIVTSWIGIVQWIVLLLPIVFFMGGRPRPQVA